MKRLGGKRKPRVKFTGRRRGYTGKRSSSRKIRKGVL